MEEVMEVLEEAKKEKNADEAQIESLRQKLSSMQNAPYRASDQHRRNRPQRTPQDREMSGEQAPDRE
jgi:hypothetical protein